LTPSWFTIAVSGMGCGSKTGALAARALARAGGARRMNLIVKGFTVRIGALVACRCVRMSCVCFVAASSASSNAT
jgi:hypothetical protein